jgi:hypothetical protein
MSTTSTIPKLKKLARYLSHAFKRKPQSDQEGARKPHSDHEESRTSESDKERSRRILTWLCAIGGTILAIVVFLTGIIVLLGYLIFHPALPSFTVKAAALNTLLLDATFVLTSETTILLHVHNPNAKVTVNYESLRFELQFERHAISSYSLGAFSQVPKNTTERLFVMAANRVQLEANEGEDLSYCIQRNSVTYDFVGTVRTKAKFGHISSMKYWLHFRCHMEFNPPPIGNMTLTKSHCNSWK